MKTLLVTGGIGSGKSAVCAYLQERGIPVYDSDRAVKRLYASDPDLLPALETLFGTSLRLPDGSLDRQKLSGILFSDRSALARLESVVHPAVLRDFVTWRNCQQAPWVVMESAIALQKPLFDGVYDAVLLVTAPEAQRLDRACRRDGADREAVLARMAVQAFDPMQADAVVNNDGDLPTLRHRTDIALKVLSLHIEAAGSAAVY